MTNDYYVTHLYPNLMSIYGDYGNIITLRYWCEKIGLNFIYQPVEIGEELPANTNLYFFGGGQDKEQMLIYSDLLTKKSRLVEDLINKNIGMLAICGGYQALGQMFVTGDGHIIPGLGILSVTTTAPENTVSGRAIGNLIVKSDFFGATLVGFENHSGQTYFVNNNLPCQPIGDVVHGWGNNTEQKQEGCIYKNIIGTYMHGPFLPKNPEITKWLIAQTAKLDVKQLHTLQNFDTSLESKAKNQIIKKLVKIA